MIKNISKSKLSNKNNTVSMTSFSKNSEEYWPQILDDLKQRGKGCYILI